MNGLVMDFVMISITTNIAILIMGTVVVVMSKNISAKIAHA